MGKCENNNNNNVRVLCFNAFMRPPGIHSGSSFSTGDYKDLRLSYLAEKIQHFDIVLLQEMFGFTHRQQFLQEAGRKHGLVHSAGPLTPSFFGSTQLLDAGLMILSRYPIVKTDALRFTKCSGADAICSKGVLYAAVNIPTTNTLLHVFTTHTQAGEHRVESDIRIHQLTQMSEFVKSTINSSPTFEKDPILIGGDFNLDARHDYSFSSSGTISSRDRVEEDFNSTSSSLDYKILSSLMTNANSNMVNLMESYGQEAFPVTNGIGHGRLHYEPGSAHSDIGKCIDYFFGANIMKSFVRKIYVDECRITPRGNDTLPVTHLSDHFGLVLKLRFTNEQKQQQRMHHAIAVRRLATNKWHYIKVQMVLTTLVFIIIFSLMLVMNNIAVSTAYWYRT